VRQADKKTLDYSQLCLIKKKNQKTKKGEKNNYG
jgi:hypothetical protein